MKSQIVTSPDNLHQVGVDNRRILKSHFVTLNESGNKKGRHIKKLPFAFAEQGIYMLATVLRGFHCGASSEDVGRKVCENF